MLLLGIDPGLSGAYALLDPDTWQLSVGDLPLIKTTTGKEELDLHTLATTLRPRDNDRCIAILEKVSAMPKQGVSSMFRFGQTYGALQMLIIGHGYESHFPVPRVWKKHFHLGSDGNASRALAMQRFPANAGDFKLVKHHGRAEAALLALYGAETIYLKSAA